MRDLGVILGVHDKKTLDNGKARIYKIAKIIVHALYSEGSVEKYTYIKNDIALFRVQKEIKFDHYVRPICLPNKGKIDDL